MVSTPARARRQRKTRPGDVGRVGGCALTAAPILLPGSRHSRRRGPVRFLDSRESHLPPPLHHHGVSPASPDAPVGWRAVAFSSADTLLAVLAALPRDADLVVVRRE